MGLKSWLGIPDFQEIANNAQREADRQLIRETIQAMKESQIETAKMLSEAIKQIATVQQTQAGAIQTHLELFRGPQALEEGQDDAPEVDPETTADEFPWTATPQEQAAWLNAHMDDE